MESKQTDKHFLAVLVHRTNPDIIDDPTTIPEGATKSTIQREERAAAAKKGDKFVGANETGVKIATAEREQSERLMAIKETGMQISCEQMQCNLITSQLTVMKEYEEMLKATWTERGSDGDSQYRNTMTNMIEELPLIKKQKREAEAAKKAASTTNNEGEAASVNGDD